MDPVSTIGLLGSVFGIIDAIAKSVAYLSSLQSSYKIADLKVWLLIAQLSTLKAALNQVAELINLRPDTSRDTKLVKDLSVALSCVEAVVFALDDRLSNIQRNEDRRLKAFGKMSFVWDEQIINDYQGLLNNQVNALNLFLTALQCRTTVEQTRVVEGLECQSLLRIVRDDTSSLLWLRDSESIGTCKSAVPQDLGTITTTFGFDTEIFASKVYRTATRSSMLRNLLLDATAGDQQSFIGPIPENARSLVSIHPPRDQLGASSTTAPEEHPGTLNTELERLPLLSALPKYTIYHLEALHRLPISTSPSMALSLPNPKQQEAARQDSHVTTNLLTGESLGQDLGENPPSQGAKPDVKVLIMGISESGKSTLVKSLKEGYMRGYNREERLDYVTTIRQNLWLTTHEIAKAVRKDEQMSGSFSREVRGDKKAVMAACELLEACTYPYDNCSVDRGDPVSRRHPPRRLMRTDISSAIRTVWEETQFHQMLEKAILTPSFYTMDGAKHMASSSNRILDPSYIPTVEDIMYARTKTSGVRETQVVYDGTIYHFFDLGGTKLERRHWTRAFGNVDTIVFTCDVSCYDSMLLEDMPQNRMLQQILVFKSIVDSKYFSSSQIIVLFTKEDKLTARKLLASPFQAMFPDYDGHPEEVEDILNYLVFRLRSGIQRSTADVIFCRSDSISSYTSMGEVAMNAIQRRGHFPPES